MKLLHLVTGIMLCLSQASAATILTFDFFPLGGTTPNSFIPQAYGDNVSAASDAVGIYGTDDGTYTPNVTVAYGGAIDISAKISQ